jgi:hypothetical protein
LLNTARIGAAICDHSTWPGSSFGVSDGAGSSTAGVAIGNGADVDSPATAGVEAAFPGVPGAQEARENAIKTTRSHILEVFISQPVLLLLIKSSRQALSWIIQERSSFFNGRTMEKGG